MEYTSAQTVLNGCRPSEGGDVGKCDETKDDTQHVKT